MHFFGNSSLKFIPPQDIYWFLPLVLLLQRLNNLSSILYCYKSLQYDLIRQKYRFYCLAPKLPMKHSILDLVRIRRLGCTSITSSQYRTPLDHLTKQVVSFGKHFSLHYRFCLRIRARIFDYQKVSQSDLSEGRVRAHL